MPFDSQIYRLASIAREKLCREAARASHDLRVLVAHANILDELLIELNAPGGASMEHYGFDLQPQEVHTERTAHRNMVVHVEELSEYEAEDEKLLKTSTNLILDSSPSALPMLSHDMDETDSDSASDSDESDDSDDFSVISPLTSPTDADRSLSSVDENVEPEEADLGLRRTKSVWRLFGSSTPSSEERTKRNDLKSVNKVSDDFNRMKLSTVERKT